MTATRLEQRIFRDILAEKIEFEEGQKALADPEAWKLQMKGFKNLNRYRTPFVHTPRGIVYWQWTLYRNAAGFFIGNRVVRDKDGKEKQDQFVARRTKRRLVRLMQDKATALEAKYPNQEELAHKKAAAAKVEREKKMRVPRFSPKEYHLYCTIIDKAGKNDPHTHRVGMFSSPEAAKKAADEDRRGCPPSLLRANERHYRLYRAKWTKAELPTFSLT
jgi:hypothetical protein